MEGEKVLKYTGEGAHRPPWPAGPLQQGLRRIGVLVFQESAKSVTKPQALETQWVPATWAAKASSHSGGSAS